MFLTMVRCIKPLHVFRRLPEVPVQSVDSAVGLNSTYPKNHNQLQSNSNVSSSRPYPSTDAVKKIGSQSSRKPTSSSALSSSYDVTQPREALSQQTEINSSMSIDHSSQSAFRLIKPIAKRPQSYQQDFGSSEYLDASGDRYGYPSAPPTVPSSRDRKPAYEKARGGGQVGDDR